MQTKSIRLLSITYFMSLYHDLYTNTDGIYCDINSEFADELIRIAEHIKKVKIREVIEGKHEHHDELYVDYSIGCEQKNSLIWFRYENSIGLSFDAVSYNEEITVTVDNEILSATTDYTAKDEKLLVSADYLNGLELGFHTLSTNTGRVVLLAVVDQEPTKRDRFSAESLLLDVTYVNGDLTVYDENGNNWVLTESTDYSVENDMLVLSAEFLNSLGSGLYLLMFSDGSGVLIHVI